MVAAKSIPDLAANTATEIPETKLPKAHASIFPPAIKMSCILLSGVSTNTVISDI